LVYNQIVKGARQILRICSRDVLPDCRFLTRVPSKGVADEFITAARQQSAEVWADEAYWQNKRSVYIMSRDSADCYVMGTFRVLPR
jgi:hypothetical protein